MASKSLCAAVVAGTASILALIPVQAHAQRGLAGGIAGGILGGVIAGAIIANSRPAYGYGHAPRQRVVRQRPVPRKQVARAAPAVPLLPEAQRRTAMIDVAADPFSRLRAAGNAAPGDGGSVVSVNAGR